MSVTCERESGSELRVAASRVTAPCGRASQYNLAFYMQYLVRWPEYFEVAETPSGRFMGYIMGKAEVRVGLSTGLRVNVRGFGLEFSGVSWAILWTMPRC